MKDKDYELVRSTLLPVARKWIGLMGLGWDEVDLLWSDNYFSPEVEGHPSDCLAFANADWKYLHGSVTFNCPKIHQLYFSSGTPNMEKIDELVRHELAHILVNEMREWRHDDTHRAIDHEERVCTRIARMLAYVYQAGVDAASATPASSLTGTKP